MSPAHRLYRLLPASIVAMVQGLAAYGAAELGTRLLRVVAIIVIARHIAPDQIGIAALALALFEFIRVLANCGIGQRIIAASDADLPAICNRAHRLFHGWCALVALVQLLAAAIMWQLFGQGAVAAMLAVLSLVYFMMPPGLVQVFLLMREGRMATTARIAAVQTVTDHLLSMLLALLLHSAWAIVLPKLLTAPIWLLQVRRARAWRPSPGVAPAPAQDFFRFGLAVLGTELVTVARQQLDKLVIGALLGTQALGYYYFAFNAGLGITGSIVSAISIVLFPQLCRQADDAAQRRLLGQALALSLAIFLPIIAAQVLLAHIYVPLLYGERWAGIAPLVAILCLGGVPAVFGAVCTAWLRALGRPERDALLALVVTGSALLALAAGCSFGLAGAAWGYVAALWCVQFPVAALIIATAIRRRSVPSSNQKVFA
jgi:O-antigen/teichoic acid export membrane protein